MPCNSSYNTRTKVACETCAMLVIQNKPQDKQDGLKACTRVKLWLQLTKHLKKQHGTGIQIYIYIQI